MDIVRLLLSYGAEAGRLAAFGTVVVTDEDAGLLGQGQDVLDALVESLGVAARKVGARRAGIGHHQGVVDEGVAADHIGDGRQGVAWGEDDPPRQVADSKRITGLEETVPLAPVGREVVVQAVDVLPQLLDADDFFADRSGGLQLLVEIGRGGEVVGVGMGVQQPFDGQAFRLDVVQDGVGVAGRGRRRLLVEIPDRIDDRAFAADRVGDDILPTAGLLVVERRDARSAVVDDLHEGSVWFAKKRAGPLARSGQRPIRRLSGRRGGRASRNTSRCRRNPRKREPRPLRRSWAEGRWPVGQGASSQASRPRWRRTPGAR